MNNMLSPFFYSRRIQVLTLLAILYLGFFTRMVDLTDLPLEFHSTRQLLSALKARGMYYQTLKDAPAEQRSFAVQQWQFRASVEPEIFERLVAFTYRFMGEQVWVARVYSSLFWMIGAYFLYLFARGLTSEDGALVATAFYVFLPYAMTASRSFQPDPLMVMLILVFLWAVQRWSQSSLSGKAGWVFAMLAGLFGGLAIFVKFVAAFFVIGGGIGALLRRGSIVDAFKQPQVYFMGFLGILPGAAYVIYGVFVAGYLGQQFEGRFIPSLLISPSYYLGWVSMLNMVFGGVVFALSLLGLFFASRDALRFLIPLWLGYGLFGLYFNYHISSHDYYSLPLIPIAALTFGLLAAKLLELLAETTQTRLTRFAAFLILILGLFMSLWQVRAQWMSVDYRPEAQMWAEIRQKLGDKTFVGLTQDYGARLAYWGWISGLNWPQAGDINYRLERGGKFDFNKTFSELTYGKDFFLVTDFDQLKRQPLLMEKLQSYSIVFEGNGYIIYGLGQ